MKKDGRRNTFYTLCAWLHLVQKHSCISVLDSLKPLISLKRVRFRKEWYSTASHGDVDGMGPPKALVLPFSQIIDNFKQLLKELSMLIKKKLIKWNKFSVLHGSICGPHCEFAFSICKALSILHSMSFAFSPLLCNSEEDSGFIFSILWP